MQFDERIRIPTPEGVGLDLTLAGLGSRIVAATFDALIQAAALFGVAVVLGAVFLGLDSFTPLVGAIVLLAGFAVIVGYPAVFETFSSGRTPGKAAMGIRVVDRTGQPVRFLPALLRNLVRIVDLLPGAYAVGAVSILATRHNQRVGDIVARTIVIRDRTARPDLSYLSWVDAKPNVGWDVSQVTPEQVLAIRRYFERRPDLPRDVRSELAARLAWQVLDHVHLGDRPESDEEFLLRVLSEKLVRSGF